MLRFLLMALVVCLQGLAIEVWAQPTEVARLKIVELERKLAALPADQFDWALHNELRHLYGGFDERKSMLHCNIILKHSRMDDYMMQVLGGKESDSTKAITSLSERAARYADLPHLAAALWIKAAERSDKPAIAADFYRKALAVKGLDAGYRDLAESRLSFDVAKSRRAWPKDIPAPQGLEKTPGPWLDPVDLAVWPNQTSRANSDSWLVQNHDRIRSMRPRLLLINFSNEHSREHLDRLTGQLIAALAESSRYHGHKDEHVSAFLKYEVFKFVDLRDADRKTGDSRLTPIKNPLAKAGFNMKYRAYFSDEFAKHYGVPDPSTPGRFLRLDELIDGGYVHEVWFFGSGAPEKPQIGAYEVVEEKPQYDDHFQRKSNQFVQAGNGGDQDQPWTGRSVRLGFVNASRGIGCFMESLSHGMEGMANSGAIPYYTKYFRDYAGFNLKERFKLPFDSLYGVNYGGHPIRYLNEKTMVVTHDGKEYRIDNYICTGGNVHFPPNGRSHYDLQNERPVLSTAEDWRIGSGPGGKDLVTRFTNAAFRNYLDQAPDCMGAWLIYWRQNIPGRDNLQKDDQGKPMKNWWPFLFY
ncbi:MAG: hypothetical protein JWM11_2575 [Planctomycetaceae bacterium]|nr:hypothetical protein [Planctomycetaceae bacterium]